MAIGWSGSGTDSGGTVITCSPLTRNGSRLVARIHSLGADCSSVTASVATASTRCSQLSSTSSRCWPASRSESTSNGASLEWCRIPSVLATVSAIRLPLSSEPKSTSQTPSRKVRPTPAATRSARRVLPIPPGPVNVTSLDTESVCRTSASSCRRLTKLVTSTGRLVPRWPRPVVPAITR